jgi:hypothetical protein
VGKEMTRKKKSFPEKSGKLKKIANSKNSGRRAANYQ